MYMRPARAPRVYSDRGLASTATVAVAVALIGVLLFGFWPTSVLHLSDEAARSLAQTASSFVAGL